MRDIFVTVVVFGSLPFILYRPYIGVLMWSWIGYMNPHRLSWGFATDFPFAMIIGVTTIIAMLFAKEPKKIPWTRESIILVLFIAWMMITTVFALHPELAVPELKKVLKIQVMTFITMILITDRRRLDQLIWVIVLSLGFYGFKGGLFTILTGGNYHVLGPPGTFIGGNNEMGLALIMILPLMRYLQLQAKSAWVRYGLLAGMGLCVVAILGTQSRGDMLGLAMIGVWLLWKSRKRFALMVLGAIGLTVAAVFMPQSWHDRMETIETYQQDESAMGRINAWYFAFNLAKDHPLTGGGFDTFQADLFAKYAPKSGDVHDSHSIYFEVLGEHGYVGLFLFLALGIFVWRACSQISRTTKDKAELQWKADLARMLQVSLIGYATSGTFLGLANFDLYYHLVAIVILLKSMQVVVVKESGSRDLRLSQLGGRGKMVSNGIPRHGS